MLWLPAPRRALPADALLFSAAGSAQFAGVASAAALEAGNIDFTLAARFRIDSDTGASQFIAGKFNGAVGSGEEYGLFYHDFFNRLTWQVNLDGSTLAQAFANNLGAPALGTWYVATCTHDATNDRIRIWVNAAAVNETAYSNGIKTGGEDFQVGCDSTNLTFKLDGAVDWVGVWKGRVLESADHTLLVNSGSTLSFAELDAGLLTSLTAWYDFDTGASPTPDKVGSLNLAWTGTPTPISI